MAKTADTPIDKFFENLADFADLLTQKFTAQSTGEPEDQLKGPVDGLLSAFGETTSQKLVLKGESRLEGRLGRPDFAAHIARLPIGYIELKAPGKGANPVKFKGHDQNQWKRFQVVPNIIYTDGNEWALYRSGELVSKRVRFSGDIQTDGRDAVTLADAKELFQLLADFTSWTPVVPTQPKKLAEFLAPFCLLLRDEVIDSLADSSSPMHSLKEEIKKLLFPDADNMQFADAYAQTVIFALLLAHLEKADVLDLRNAYDVLDKHHSLLSRSLEFLTDKEAQKEIDSSLSLAQRIIHEIPLGTFNRNSSATKDPWLFFYEDFLSAYDPELRKKAGAYYTPLEVVQCQVSLIDEILRKKLHKTMGFVEPGVVTLDPAVGTGTYLLGIIDHALQRVEQEEGEGAVRGGARMLVTNLHGFEWMVGPYAVAQMRFSQALTAHGTTLPPDGIGIYLTNTLESPHTNPPAPPLFHKPIAKEHERALKIKDSQHVLVCLGNPPYGRHDKVETGKIHDGTTNRDLEIVLNAATTGGWVRHGDSTDQSKPILEAFTKPVTDAGKGVHLKNLYNLYVYFIRWSLWKVFEHKTATGPGILSFITASSYLDGEAFMGLREHMRKVCDHIAIIDLGGECRGTRKSENVFAIQTPVAIFVAWREGKSDPKKPADVQYVRIDGTREEKLKQLENITSIKNLKFTKAPTGWTDSFLPKKQTGFFAWPNLTDLVPWQHSGAQFKRTWPICPNPDTLKVRWRAMLSASDLSIAFKETRDRKVGGAYPSLLLDGKREKPLDQLPQDAPVPNIKRYAYRSFDRQWVLGDNRLGDFVRPDLWAAHSDRQIYLSTMFQRVLDGGPAMTCAAYILDLNHFCNRGAKDTIPLYRDSSATQPNILPGLLELLSKEYGRPVSPEDFAGYIYAVLAQPAYTAMFHKELGDKAIHVPLTKSAELFDRLSEFGKALIWLHTYGERLADDSVGRPTSQIPRGKAKCKVAVGDSPESYPDEFSYNPDTQTLHVGAGQFGPISSDVWEFEVSGLKVVKSWLGYRMKNRSGRKSSPLDDIHPTIWTREFDHELLELLWVLEKTVADYPQQEEMLDQVLQGDLFMAAELPEVPDSARQAPAVARPSKQRQLF